MPAANALTATELNDITGPSALGVSPDAIPIDPSGGDVVLDRPIRALRVTTAGNVVAVTGAGETRTMAFLAGETRYVVMTQINQTGTTATGLEGMP